MLDPVNDATRRILNRLLEDMEKQFDTDFLNVKGPIDGGLDNIMLHAVEDIAVEDVHDKLLIMVTTNGGDALVVERLVNILRHHYKEINFIIPDYAYSAGTIWCMSGDNILMDYYSALGPIDPQIQNKDGRWVPALGYLDKIRELTEKAQNGTMTEAEFLILKDFDLAEIRAYEQAKELTMDLLQDWLVKYKFKAWETHGNGDGVTLDEKKEAALKIAEELNNYGRWKSHGRPLNIDTLRGMGLKIIDFGENEEQKRLIRTYYSTMDDFCGKLGFQGFVHTRRMI